MAVKYFRQELVPFLQVLSQRNENESQEDIKMPILDFSLLSEKVKEELTLLDFGGVPIFICEKTNACHTELGIYS